MFGLLHEIFRGPSRLSPGAARFVLGLAAVALGIAGLGFALYDGWQRVAYVSAFLLMSLANVLLALGSLLPEQRGGRLARIVMQPVTVLMLIALGAALTFQFALVS